MQNTHSNTRRQVTSTAGMLLVAATAALLPWPAAAQETPPTGTRPVRVATNDIAPSTGVPAEGGRRSERPSPGGSLSRPPMPTTVAPTNVAPARLEATVYEVQVPQNRIAELDAKQLESGAGTAQGLAKALAGFGETKVLYKIDQEVNLYGEHIMIGSSQPVVTGSRTTGTGQAINSVTYQQTGLMVGLAGAVEPKTPQAEGLAVQVNFQLAAMTPGTVETAPGVKTPSMHNVQFSQGGMPKFGRPAVLLSLNAASGEANKPAVAYVVRYVFHKVQ